MIAYTRPDGGVSVVMPVSGTTPEQSYEAVPSEAANVTEVDALPSRTYRESWRIEGGKVVHDMEACRAMKLAELREARNAMLAETDAMCLRAQEQGDAAELARLKAHRQKLRDLPATVRLDSLNDVEALKMFVPDTLKPGGRADR